jgi:short-subunit dehydrogenase
MTGRGLRAVGAVCDVGDSDQVRAMGATILERYGCPHVVVNNAGFATYRTFEQSDLDEVVRHANVDYIGALRVTKVFLGEMINRRSGQIVNLASIAGAVLLTPNAVYCGAKHGMVAWSRCLDYEVRRFGIRVNVVCPGRVETPFFDHETFKRRAPRREAGMTVPLDTVVDRTWAAAKRNRRIIFIPSYLGLLSWGLKVTPFLSELVYGRLFLSRVDAIYRDDACEGLR